MKRLIPCFLIAILLLLAGCDSQEHPLATTQTPPSSQTWRMVGYYPSWVTSTRAYPPSSVPADLLTHLNYAFVIPNWDGICARIMRPRPK